MERTVPLTPGFVHWKPEKWTPEVPPNPVTLKAPGSPRNPVTLTPREDVGASGHCSSTKWRRRKVEGVKPTSLYQVPLDAG